MYCNNCGTENTDGAAYCVNCATPLNGGARPVGGKSKLVAGLLALFLGCWGIHNFYLGYTSKGLTQLLVSLVGGIFSCGIATIVIAIWSLVEAIQIFTGTIGTDASGAALRD